MRRWPLGGGEVRWGRNRVGGLRYRHSLGETLLFHIGFLGGFVRVLERIFVFSSSAFYSLEESIDCGIWDVI